MQYKDFGSAVVVRIDRGEEILEQLKLACEAAKVTLASVSALGAINEFTVGVWDVENKQYISNEFQGVYEITAIVGTVTTKEGAFYPHLHLTAADAQGRAFGGHLNRAVVSATCELVLHRIDGVVERRFDEGVGLNLMTF